MTLRNERVRKELMRDISDILRKEIRGLAGVVSVLDVEVSHDNSFAKVIQKEAADIITPFYFIF